MENGTDYVNRNIMNIQQSRYCFWTGISLVFV